MEVEIDWDELYVPVVGVKDELRMKHKIYEVPDELAEKWFRIQGEFEKATDEMDRFLEENKPLYPYPYREVPVVILKREV